MISNTIIKVAAAFTISAFTIVNAAEPVKVFASKTKGSVNIAENTLDGDLTTRWNAKGNGEYIQYKFAESTEISAINIAFFKGDKRSVSFQIESTDTPWSANPNWQQQPLMVSDKTTDELQTYTLTEPVTAKFFRIVGYGFEGNWGWSGDLFSINEIEFVDSCPNTDIDASGCDVVIEPVDITVQAEDYTSYFDVTEVNQGGADYRNDEVDIQVSTDEGAGYHIGYIDDTEWLEYEVALNAGTYEINTRVASGSGGGLYTLSLNGNVIGSDSVENTGSWGTFVTHTNVGSFTVNEGSHTLRMYVNNGSFNLNWLQVVSIIDDDNDGIANHSDNCPDTPAAVIVDGFGCEMIIPLTEVAFNNDILVGGSDSDKPGYALYTFDNDENGVSNCNDSCAVNWPPLLVTDGSASGIPNLSTVTRTDGSEQVAYNGKPLYFYIGDTGSGTNNGDTIVNWQVQTYGVFGDVVPLYTADTELEHAILYETSDAVITKFSDRGRDRHGKEDQFQAHDHYLAHYWEHRTARYKFTDFVAKGGSSILIEWVTEFELDAKEFRAWYYGYNTVAEYHGNLGGDVTIVASGTFDDDLVQISDTGYQFKYSLSINQYRGLNGSYEDLSIGQYMEIEVSQFLNLTNLIAAGDDGRDNYYGTTYLYQVGKGGMVPWKTVGDFDDKESERENSYPIAKSGWLGGNTTLHYQYTNEPDDHFMQMATNLSSLNGQAFVLGRRLHHTSFVTGLHDESADNGSFDEMAGKAGTHYVNDSCASCHERNGRAAPAEEGEALDRWVFKIADSNGDADTNRGKVLQPTNAGDVTGEGTVAIASWTESDGLRSPNYVFSTGTPDKFSARIAPQLVGLGLLEAIPEEDILALADEEDNDNDGISGKAQLSIDPITQDVRLGRFGWKAGTSSVKHQIAGAFNTDMGVMTSLLPTPDCGASQLANEECATGNGAVSDEHLEELTKYVSLLGIRAQRDLDNADVQKGQVLFSSIGCADCHTPTFQTSLYHPYTELRDQTIHPYSDMLLHDMGEGLADNLGEGNASGAEWRTTPLWGLGLSACVTGGVTNPTGIQGDEICTPVHSYLHDGRARTIDEAILWHGGESSNVTANYKALSESDKSALLSFLESL